MRLAGHGRVPAHWTRSHWVPDLVWLVAESERGVVLSFKGADPLWQVNLRADPPLSKRGREGVVGKVHCGLWRGLHQAAPGAAPGTSVADLILETLRQTGGGSFSSSPSSSTSSTSSTSSNSSSSSRLSRRGTGGSSAGMRRRQQQQQQQRKEEEGEEERGAGSDDTANNNSSGGEDAPANAAAAAAAAAAPSSSSASFLVGKPIFLCGHSLGGGLAALLAAVIAGKHPDLSSRVAGVFTFAAPRFGDEEFAAHFSEIYRGRAFRYVHASDMVCKLPPGFGYGHHAAERFITSFPTRKANASASGRILREEIDGAEVMNAAAKLEDRAAHAFHFVKLALAAAGMGGWFESSLVGGPLRWWWGRKNGSGGQSLSSSSSRSSSSSSATYSSSPLRARHGARHGSSRSNLSISESASDGNNSRRRQQQQQQQNQHQLLRPTPSSRLLVSNSSSSSSLSAPASSSSSSSSKGESRVRLALRWALLACPGFSDHFLCEYERALRAEVWATEADAAAEAEAAAEQALAFSMTTMMTRERRNNSILDVRRGQAEEAEVSEVAEAEGEEPLSPSPRLPFPAPPAVRTSASASAAEQQRPPLSPFSASIRRAGSGAVTAAIRVSSSLLQNQQQAPSSQQQQQQLPKAVSPLTAAAALVRGQLSRAFPSIL